MDAYGPEREQQAVADAIERYLSEHPQSADTAPGIQRWWVLPRCGEVSLQNVEAALAKLEQGGVMQKVDEPWGATVWMRALP